MSIENRTPKHYCRPILEFTVHILSFVLFFGLLKYTSSSSLLEGTCLNVKFIGKNYLLLV